MDQRISMVTLGVADVARSASFYEALGWRRANAEPQIAFFQLNGSVLGLWSRTSLAEEATLADSGGFGGIALAHNVRSRAEVDAVLAEAGRAGARILKQADDTFWGGYSGYFADPDNHPWEVAWNPFWELTAEGNVVLPEPPAA